MRGNGFRRFRVLVGLGFGLLSAAGALVPTHVLASTLNCQLQAAAFESIGLSGLGIDYAGQTTCDASAATLSGTATLSANGTTVSSAGPDTCSNCSSTSSQGHYSSPVIGQVYTLTYRVSMTLASGNWGSTTGNCTGGGTPTVTCSTSLTYTFPIPNSVSHLPIVSTTDVSAA